MIELIEANWLLILLAVLVGFVIAWFLLSGSRKTKVTREEPGDDAAGARRNQALIDALPIGQIRATHIGVEQHI